MMIKSLYISGLFNEYEYNLDISVPLTFVHSPNGLGKSTLMRMLYAALKGDLKYLSEVPFQRMDIGFEDDTVMIIENIGGQISVLMQRNEIRMPLTPDEMADVRDTVYIPPERLAIRKRDGHLAPTLEVYAQELLEQFRYVKEHSELVPGTGSVPEDLTDGELEFLAKDLKAKLDFIKDAGFEPDIPAGMKFPPSRYDIQKDRAGYIGLTASISDYVRRNYVLAESVIIFKDIVNEFLVDKSITVSDRGRFEISMNNGTALQLQRLSSGEKQIIIMFYALLFHAEPGSLVILDEPEISLHVSWQQKLGRYFNDICRVRDIQMIVATHSPQVIHDMWDSARELRPSNARVPDV